MEVKSFPDGLRSVHSPGMITSKLCVGVCGECGECGDVFYSAYHLNENWFLCQYGNEPSSYPFLLGGGEPMSGGWGCGWETAGVVLATSWGDPSHKRPAYGEFSPLVAISCTMGEKEASSLLSEFLLVEYC